MGFIGFRYKPHAVFVPFPAQGHINPMLKFAKLLHRRGFHITFRTHALNGLPSFRFETIPDGLPPTDADATQDIPALCESTSKTCLPHFKKLIHKLNNSSPDVPPVSCIVSDVVMSFTLDAAEELGVPEVLFWTTSACGFLGYCYYRQLMEKGYIPLKAKPERARKASAIILNTLDDLEHEVLRALSSMLPPIYSLGPLHLPLNHQVHDHDLKQLGSNLWKEEPECLQWLDSKEPNSVVYVNFGSITVMTPDQLIEFAWGLANSNQTFLWVIRPNLVGGESAVLPQKVVKETKDRGFLASWWPQEKVLSHPAVGGFLTQGGWNSTSGVPMIFWPFFAEQQTNCRFSCNEWGVGMEINNDVKRDEVEGLVRELIEGEKGKVMKKNALEWKRKWKRPPLHAKDHLTKILTK
ncbi:hypothetical protein DITRI_Ditri03aG0165100 [Diplodiscus trichospermus]